MCFISIFLIKGFDYPLLFSQSKLEAYFKQIKGSNPSENGFYLKLASLRKLYNAHSLKSKDSVLVDAMLFWAIYHASQNPLESVEELQKVIILAEDVGFKDVKASAYREIGVIYWRQGFYDEALTNFFIASNDFAHLRNMWTYGFSLVDIGNIYFAQGNFQFAQNYYTDALTIFQDKIKNRPVDEAEAVCFNNIGLVYSARNLNDSALYFFNRALECRKKLKLLKYYGHSYRYIASTYHNLGELDSANSYYQRAVDSDAKYSPADEYINSCIEYADFLKSARDTILAGIFYKKACKIAKSQKCTQKQAIIANKLAEFFYPIYLDSSLHYFSIALSLSEQINQIDVNMKALDGLALIYRMRKDTERELYYLKKRLLLDKELYHNMVTNTQFNHELSKTIRQKEELENSNFHLKLSIFTITLISILLIILVIQMFKAKKRKEAFNQLLTRQKEEITRQNERIEKAMNDLTELKSYKDAMMGMIVHDLKNPLNIILSLSKSLLETEAARQMMVLIDNILDLKKLESNKMKVNFSDFDICGLVNEVLKKTSFLAGKKKLTVLNLLPENLQVNADYDLLERIVTNLMTNAIKFSPDDDTIKIEAFADEDGLIKISITDNGPGVPNDMQAILFEQFTQLIQKKSGIARSTGLGLAFCKLAIEANGGKIGIVSINNSGSTFWFTIQVSKI